MLNTKTHPAWTLLLNDPDFWSLLNKDHLPLLSSTCRSFRSDIPQRVAIMALFKDRPIKKVTLFRLLPLSVNDVLGLRSPVDFLTAFSIAEKKSGGFDRCLAIVREKGLLCWAQDGEKRAKKRAHFEAQLARLGVTDLPTADPVYRAAMITQSRGMDSVAVWTFETADRELPSRITEYAAIMQMLRLAVGFWYKGVNRDARSALAAVRAARAAGRDRCTVVLLSSYCLIVGLVTLKPPLVAH